MSSESLHRDVVVIGSGFGGCMAAWSLVEAGRDVLMLERGPWVERGEHNWGPEGTLTRSPYFADRQLRVVRNGRRRSEGTCACVGGPSVFYGGVSTRFRAEDFEPHPEIVADSGARWPFRYRELRPHYRRAEEILGISGAGGDGDPTAPEREVPHPQPAPDLSPTARMMGEAARRKGWRPYRLPLAINYGISDRRPSCRACDTCDTFACAIRAKNDLAARVIPGLRERGMELRPRTAVLRLEVEDGGVRAAVCRDPAGGRETTVTADTFVLAAGALGSAQIALASGLHGLRPAGHAVGRYLTRHCAGIVFGLYPRLPDDGETFHKQMGINDFYFGDDARNAPAGKLGNIQQVQSPAPQTVGTLLPRPLPRLLSPLLRRATGLLVLAEDQPRYENHVTLDPAERDGFGLRRAVVHHRHTRRDLAARAALARRARELHREAGALLCYEHRIETFSHALGTLRMGEDPTRNPVNPEGRFRGLENLWVADGSLFPTSAGVNPSLTIAALGLRVGARAAADEAAPASRQVPAPSAAGGSGDARQPRRKPGKDRASGGGASSPDAGSRP